MCVALAALDATVFITGPKGERKIDFTNFHRLPGDKPELDNNLQTGELITSIHIPTNKFNKSYYLKIRDRASYAFALVSVAVALEINNNVIRSARIAMGGVAHKPWRLIEVEKFLSGKNATDEIFENASEIAMQEAKTFKHNSFKIKLGKAAIREALSKATV
jgi:xanthine dehydrogenase YagS FAD-binding subunit